MVATVGCANLKVKKIGLTMENEHQFVLIVWADAHAGEGHWDTLDPDDKDEHLVATVGMLVAEQDGGKPKHLTVAQSKSPDGFFDHVIHIPSAMMRSVTFLTPFTKPIDN
jgi:hypothetical protein